MVTFAFIGVRPLTYDNGRAVKSECRAPQTKLAGTLQRCLEGGDHFVTPFLPPIQGGSARNKPQAKAHRR
jgi:hypothetical protein